MSYNPIAYTYDADYHCPECAEARFGRDDRGDIAGEGALDSENNEPGAVAPWSDHCGIWCGTCGDEVEPHPEFEGEVCGDCGAEQ